MLNQAAFEQRHSPSWQKLESNLDNLESLKLWKRTTKDVGDLPTLYSALCRQHAIAVSRGYSYTLTERLRQLIARAHNLLYRQKGRLLGRTISFFGGGFAAAVRKESRLFWLSCLLFFGTAIVCGVMSAFSADIADVFLGTEQRENLEFMYAPSDEPLRPPGMEHSSNFMMFGFYIANNIGIDFRVFASGILFGVGSVFFMVFNGVVIGAAAGHLSGIGYHEKFWGFVAGHSAPELIALCISGTAGLMLARALVKPGRQTRRLALLRGARAAVPLIIGAGLMTLLAAFIEAYWSSQTLPLMTKLLVGAGIWLLLICYLCFTGKHKH